LVDRTVQIWNWSVGQRLAEFETVFETGGWRLALAPNGSTCVAASWKKGKRDGVACYDAPTGQTAWHRSDIRRVQGLRFSPAGDHIWCWIEGGPVQQLDSRTGATSAVVKGVQDVIESRYPGHILEVRRTGFLVRGEIDFLVPRLTFALLDAAFSSDSLCLAEASGPVRCLQLGTGVERWRFQSSGGAHVVALSHSQDDHSFYAVQRYMNGGPAALLRLPERTGIAVKMCQLSSSTVCFGNGVVITAKGDIVSLRGGGIVEQIPFPERQYPDPAPTAEEPVLHFAARFGTEKAIRNLIASGSDVDLAADNGCTALHIAATKGRLDVVRVLLELGADPNRKNMAGETAMQAAERACQSEIVGVLTAHTK